jgi:hypothetical protein
MPSKASAVARQREADGLTGLPGLEVVERQLEEVLVVLRAEQERRAAGLAVSRAAWKNLVFAGGPGVLVINGAHALYGLPCHGHQVLRRLYEKLTEYRGELHDDLAVILAGEGEPLRRLLGAYPPLAARFRAVIEFPGYTPPSSPLSSAPSPPRRA